jgi:hypothetical protein
LRVREEAGASNTLPRLVATFKKQVASDPESLSRFEIGLARAGYSPVHDEEYESLRLRIYSEELYTVNGDFPRISERMFLDGFPIGVETVNYEINLDAFDHLRIAKTPSDIADIFG